MTAFITSVIFVTLAEMGDKTQLLAMAFATRYRWQTVLWGVFAATILNHLFAVLVGHYLTRIIPMNYLQIAAAVSFIVFGLWTIHGDELSGLDQSRGRSPFWTVAIAFFAAEMGDKTQFATVALAAQFNSILPVWLGTTTGMMIADGFGIIIGIVLGRRIPAEMIKWSAVLIYVAFGLYGLYESLPGYLLTVGNISLFLAGLLLLMIMMVRASIGKTGLRGK
ncbi:MAG: TMEM165/GDT1 family protein [Negativicutes bacterium]|nr:TMEM165/GDT1 family protein [Negativicutes bacterium]